MRIYSAFWGATVLLGLKVEYKQAAASVPGGRAERKLFSITKELEPVITITLYPKSSDQLSVTEINAWRQIPVSIAVDLVPDGQIDPMIRPVAPAGSPSSFVGRAVTALCEPPDFGAVLHALESIGQGDVLVIGAGGWNQCAMIGEILCGYLCERGGTGVVCDGAVRDAKALADMRDFPVFARSINARGPRGDEHGSVNATITISGTTIRPGDLILGDNDGLTVLTTDQARSQLKYAQNALLSEQNWVQSLKQGRSIAQTFSLSSAYHSELKKEQT